MSVRLAKQPRIDYSNILETVFSLMLGGGMRPQDLVSMCMRSLKCAKASARLRGTDTGELAKAALILDAWHRDRRYLSVDGEPKSVRLLGRAPSVEALVRANARREAASIVARRLKELHLVVPSGRGRYRPASDMAVLPGDNPLVLQHAARALSTFVQTIGRNTGVRRTVAPLIERIAEVPDLPCKHIPDFEEFTQRQGRTFLRTVNDWLEARRVRRSRRRSASSTVRAGIHTYAYVAPRRRARAPI